MGRGLGGIGVLAGKRRVILILLGRCNSAESSGGILRLMPRPEAEDARLPGDGVVHVLSNGHDFPAAFERYQTVVPFLQVPGIEQ